MYQSIWKSLFNNLHISKLVELSGRRDFERNVTTNLTFGSGSRNEERLIHIPLVDDNINEADEGFLLVIEIQDSGSPTTSDDITLVRDGIALIVIADNDRELLNLYTYL